MVCTAHIGKFIVEAFSTTSDKNLLNVARRIVEILSSQPFCVTVLYTSSVFANLPKNMKLALLQEAPSTIVPVQEKLQVGALNEMQIFKEEHIEEQNICRASALKNERQEKTEERLEKTNQFQYKVRRNAALVWCRNVAICEDMRWIHRLNIRDKATCSVIKRDILNART